ncbi:nucleotidyltransferase family protein [Salinimicrobium tongyeongense]|uniref:Nucleotidyltransferase family protein n=1 Tax=Salinimicrobium tongyeongense TaxID=2809707 RepID=A0ABY6NRW7_9FLAO|nr:nucleotidyltransferase family protein [Salinimicrobium tongyeongense]UZH55524.1 nucleotidyltransferase family protein [Salinimicrobium tongyeongense]
MCFEEITIHRDQTILDALRKLNNVRSKINVSRLILFVADDNEVILGSLTDGDVRRSLIQHGNLSKRLEEICNRNFIFKFEHSGFLDLREYRKKDLKILPILDRNMRLKRIIDLEKTQSVLPLECMIMAGGRGKRLSPLTDDIPKPMLPLGEKPIIEHNIDRLISYGIRKIYISVKYLGEQIQDYFGDGSSKGISIEYVWEDKPLGTAGALALVENFETDHILLMNSDLFTNVDFEDLYVDLINQEADMAVASTEYKVDVPYAVFETEGKEVMEFKEKPSYVYYSNAGIYILKKELISKIPQNKYYDITELMEELIKEGGKLIHNPILGFWIDIGKPVDYKQAQELVKHSSLNK